MNIRVDFLAANPLQPGEYKIPIRATLPDGQTFESYASIVVDAPGHSRLVPDATEQGERLKLESALLIAQGKLKMYGDHATQE